MNEPVELCEHCGNAVPGPALLVLILIFASDRILLLRRGSEPYKGKWAPPGGFVEHAESLEAAAIREVWEEVRTELDPMQLVPHAVVSIPKMNQVYHVFKVCLTEIVPASSAPPESLDVGWFSERELATIELWDPSADVDVAALFDGVRAGRFDFFQRNDEFWRVITEQRRIKYLWRRTACRSSE